MSRCEIPEDVKKVFDDAVILKGVEYKPVAYASSVVQGVFFRSFCNAKIIFLIPLNESALILVFRSLDVKEIQRLKHN